MIKIQPIVIAIISIQSLKKILSLKNLIPIIKTRPSNNNPIKTFTRTLTFARAILLNILPPATQKPIAMLLDFLQDKQESLSYPESKIWIHTLLDIMPHMAQPKAYKKFICSTILKFNELYPKSYRKPVKDIDFEHLKQYTNSNSSAYWKQIWATQT